MYNQCMNLTFFDFKQFNIFTLENDKLIVFYYLVNKKENILLKIIKGMN